MPNVKSNLWFVSIENLFQEDGAFLRPANSSLLPTDQCIAPYDPLHISLESFCIVKQLDRKPHGNDLLVRSWTTYGQDPPVEIVHFFEKNVDLGIPIDNLAVEHMFASKSYGNQSIELDIEILEVDGHSSMAEDIKSVANLLGAIFPAILPFNSVASALYSNLKNLFKNPHDVAFSESLKLYDEALSQASSHFVPLRCGAYILFSKDVEGDRYKLRELKLEPSNSNGVSIADDYVIIKIIPQVVNSLNHDDLLANQRLAVSLLKKDDNTFDLPPKIQAKKKAFSQSFSLLQGTVKKAQALDYLVEYKRLKQHTSGSIPLLQKHASGRRIAR